MPRKVAISNSELRILRSFIIALLNLLYGLRKFKNTEDMRTFIMWHYKNIEIAFFLTSKAYEFGHTNTRDVVTLLQYNLQ